MVCGFVWNGGLDVNSIFDIGLIGGMLSSLKLERNTPLGKEELKKVKTIWQSLHDNNESYDFRNPVDWKGRNLLNQPWV